MSSFEGKQFSFPNSVKAEIQRGISLEDVLKV